MDWRRILLDLAPDPVRNRPYRTVWTLCFGVVACLGLTALAVDVETPEVMGLFLSILITVGCGAYMWAFIVEKPLRSAIPVSVTGAVTWVMTIGLAELVGPWAFLLTAVLLLLAPRSLSLIVGSVPAPDANGRPSIGQLLRDRAWQDVEPADVAGTPLDGSDLALLSLPALCRFWQETSAELARRPGGSRQLWLVRMREACLDLIRARDESGYARWLAAGPQVRPPSEFVGIRASGQGRPRLGRTSRELRDL